MLEIVMPYLTDIVNDDSYDIHISPFKKMT